MADVSDPDELRALVVEHLASHAVEELKEFARDPIILADNVSPLDGFQFLCMHNVRACPVKSADGASIVGSLDLRDISKLFVESKKRTKLEQSSSHKASTSSLGPVEVRTIDHVMSE